MNGCCKNNPCQNGGICTEICEPTSVRYNCSCPAKFIGRHCEKRKSCQSYKAAGETSSGLYTITDDSDQSFQVFCDFDSEPGFAWNLIQSFSLSKKDIFGASIADGTLYALCILLTLPFSRLVLRLNLNFSLQNCLFPWSD